MILRTLLASAFLAVLPLGAEDDISTKVKIGTEPPAPEQVIDPSGIVFGLPFGATEDDASKKFGKPAGYIRLDAKRTAMLYGKSYLLLFYEGAFDALRVGLSMIDWNVSRWIQSEAPFLDQGWRMSNGLRPDMNLKEAAAITGTEPEDRRYRLKWSTDKTNLELLFSHYTDRGNDDEAYVLHGFLLARKHEGVDFWSEPPRPGMSGNPLTGKLLAGFGVSSTKKGIRVRHVYRNSPADQAGIRPGDLIEKIDGQSTLGLGAEEFAARLMKGDPHDLVVMAKEGGTRTVAITKADGATFSGGMLPASSSDFVDVKPGDEAPGIEAVAADGTKIKLSDLRGRLVLINFTATWCEPCRRQAPELIEAHARLKDKGLEVLSVYLDGADKDVHAYAKNLGVAWPVRNDGKAWKGEAAQAYGITAVPTNILVGKDGKILRTDFRIPDLDAVVREAR